MKYVAAIAVALALFAAVQLAVKGPNPAAESMAIEVRPVALKLSQLIALAGLPEFRQYAAIIAAANSTVAQELRKLATLVKDLDREMSLLSKAAALKDRESAQLHYTGVKADLEQIRKMLVSLGIWDLAKDYYTAAYLRAEALMKSLEEKETAEEKVPAKLLLYAPSVVYAGDKATVAVEVDPPSGSLYIYLDGGLVDEAKIGRNYTFTIPINVYKPSVELLAVYVPQDPKYGSAENKTTIQVVYVSPELKLQCPREVAWGNMLIITGSTTSRAKTATLRIGWLTAVATASNGSLVWKINTTALTPAVYSAAASLPPQGIYAPATASCTVNITAPAPPVKTPWLLIAGVPVQITDYYTYTPSPLEPTGPHTISIYIPPHYPYAGIRVEFTALVLNPLQIGAAAALALALVAPFLKKRQAAAAQPLDTPTPYTYAELAAMYLRQAAARLGIALKPGTTIRELLSAVREVNEEAYKKLAKVGRRLEEVLYAGEQPTPQDYEELR